MKPASGSALCAGLAVACLAVPLRGQAPPGPLPVREVLGVVHARGTYNFTEQDYLNEGADRILELGSRVIKIWLEPAKVQRDYHFNSDWTPLAKDVVELAQRPYFKAVFAKPFAAYLLMIPAAVAPQRFLDGMDDNAKDAEHNQMYHLARYLLETYAGSGKTFVLQNWEGDNTLMEGLAPGQEPSPRRLQAMGEWLNVRQQGVDDARRDTPAAGVQVFHAIEVNLIEDAMAGKARLTNWVLPSTRADLYSYSCWDVGFDAARMVRALDYLASRAPDAHRFGSHNVYVGEFGVSRDHLERGRDLPQAVHELAVAALNWGARWAAYWQVYSNQIRHRYWGRPTERDLLTYWLIKPDGRKTAMWEDFARLLRGSLMTASVAGFERDGPLTVLDSDHETPQSGDRVTIAAADGRFLVSGFGGWRLKRAPAEAKRTLTLLRADGASGPIALGEAAVLRAPGALGRTRAAVLEPRE